MKLLRLRLEIFFDINVMTGINVGTKP